MGLMVVMERKSDLISYCEDLCGVGELLMV